MPATVTLITDGACSSNGRDDPRGGWAAILVVPGRGETVLTGSEAPTTNNRMELVAAIEGLLAAPAGSDVELVTDSSYVANAILKRWIDGWRRRGWRTADRKPVANQDLWQEFIAAAARHHAVRPVLVRGHAGHQLNERADRLAQDAAARAVPGEGRRPSLAPPPSPQGQLSLSVE